MLLRERKTNRLRNFDYSACGYYFVTICTKKRVEWFGDIVSRKTKLNNYGIIAKKYWGEISKHYRNIFLDEFVVMPNHIHGIVVITKNIHINDSTVGTEYYSVPTKYGLLSKIIKSFKHVCTIEFRNTCNNYQFQWQRSFYDHIIRNEQSLFVIRQYIHNNPLKWQEDRNNSENLFM
jgi:REP element-mobilizing transposase RayT